MSRKVTTVKGKTTHFTTAGVIRSLEFGITGGIIGIRVNPYDYTLVPGLLTSLSGKIARMAPRLVVA